MGPCGVEKAQCWDAKRWRRRQASAGKGSENPKPARGKACGFCAVCERRKEVGALAAANVKRRRPRKVSIRASLSLIPVSLLIPLLSSHSLLISSSSPLIPYPSVAFFLLLHFLLSLSSPSLASSVPLSTDLSSPVFALNTHPLFAPSLTILSIHFIPLSLPFPLYSSSPSLRTLLSVSPSSPSLVGRSPPFPPPSTLVLALPLASPLVLALPLASPLVLASPWASHPVLQLALWGTLTGSTVHREASERADPLNERAVLLEKSRAGTASPSPAAPESEKESARSRIPSNPHSLRDSQSQAPSDPRAGRHVPLAAGPSRRGSARALLSMGVCAGLTRAAPQARPEVWLAMPVGEKGSLAAVTRGHLGCVSGGSRVTCYRRVTILHS
ncbi:hypothetical protein C7M84_009011 [Penaeus vannamei]|uniref:Uncharacterized protein n=1 Tax=Penaeus vannamei TaxID=6689 RepID=A0A423T837_PENVA|nr:hypothetical protein C7M84_009011 [Penaeus vannamei]